MSKKLEQSELQYIKDLMNNQAQNFHAIGQARQTIEINIAREKELINDNLQITKDFNKNQEKLNKKYGDVTYNLEDGTIAKRKRKKRLNK